MRRQTQSAVALIWRTTPAGVLWLAQWNDKWGDFNFISGHLESGESFRECIVREICEELELIDGRDLIVAPLPRLKSEFTKFSKQAQADTDYIFEIFDVQIVRPDAYVQIGSNPRNAWLSIGEIGRGKRDSGQSISELTNRILAQLNVATGN